MVIANKHYEEYLKIIPDISGKVVAITGTTSGTGYWTAVFAIRKGVKALILLNRESNRSHEAFEKLQAEKKQAGVNTELHEVACDLQNFASVREAAENVNKIAKQYGGLDVLYNNAGIGSSLDKRTQDGFDPLVQTNHLSHFLLTSLVFPSLQEALSNGKEVRICQHSSAARHITGANHLEKFFVKSKPGSLGGSGTMAVMRRYHQTKLANVTFALKLDKMLKERGVDTSKFKSVVAEPGVAKTSFIDNVTSQGGIVRRTFNRFLLNVVAPLFFRAQSAADGSLPGIVACFGEDVNSGDFFIPEKRAVGKPIKTISQGTLAPLGKKSEEKLCLNEQNQENIWKWSEAACGKFFTDN